MNHEEKMAKKLAGATPAKTQKIENPTNASIDSIAPSQPSTAVSTASSSSAAADLKFGAGTGRKRRPKASLSPSRPGAFSVKPGAENDVAAAAPTMSRIAHEKIRANTRKPRSRSPHRNASNGRPTAPRQPSEGSTISSTSTAHLRKSPPPPASRNMLKPPPPPGSEQLKSPPLAPSNQLKAPPPGSVSPKKHEEESLPGAVRHATPPRRIKMDPNFPDEEYNSFPSTATTTSTTTTTTNNDGSNLSSSNYLPRSSMQSSCPKASVEEMMMVPETQLEANLTDCAVQGGNDNAYNCKEMYGDGAAAHRATIPGAVERASWDQSAKDMMEKSIASSSQSIKMAKSPSGTGLLPALQAVRVDSQAEIAGLAVATAEKDSCWAFFKRSRCAQIGACLGCLIVIGLIVALSLVFVEADEPPEIVFFDQLGPSLDGRTRGGRFGSSMSYNQDGTRLAVADFEDVYIYHLTEGDGGADWELIATIEAPENATIGYGLRGSSTVRNPAIVDISQDGNAVAIGWPYSSNEVGLALSTGRVEVYREDAGATWEQVGNTIYGWHSNDYFGADLALGENGDQVAAGAPGNDGHAVVFALNDVGNEWVELGNRIQLGGTLSVGSVSLRAQTFAFAGQALIGDDTATNDIAATPIARMFRFVDGDWVELGNGIVGNFASTAYLVELSANANIIVLSNYYTEAWQGELNDALDVRAFEWDESTNDWLQMGDSLHTHAPGEKSGYFITLADDGKLMGMGDPGTRSDEGGGVAGHIHIFKFKDDGGIWKQVGPNRDGDAPGDNFGYAVAMSGDGQHFASGAPFNRGEGVEVGRVYVFDLADMDKIATQEGWGGGR